MMLATGFNGFLLFGDRWYRRSISGDVRWNLAKTAVQSAGVWVGTLVVIPAAILHASGNWPPRWAGMPGILGGWAVLLLASAFNIFCGWTMAKLGGGTPFPLDSTTRLVVAGPYRHVRNPMAMAGLTQGLGVAWLVQSWEVLVYVVIGGLVWHGFVRPQEERWLEVDFGEAYRAYRREVKCWWPRWNGWGREET
jgi:protein-S-isoprenylcysteine O-methyltransferase Ste14